MWVCCKLSRQTRWSWGPLIARLHWHRRKPTECARIRQGPTRHRVDSRSGSEQDRQPRICQVTPFPRVPAPNRQRAQICHPNWSVRVTFRRPPKRHRPHMHQLAPIGRSCFPHPGIQRLWRSSRGHDWQVRVLNHKPVRESAKLPHCGCRPRCATCAPLARRRELRRRPRRLSLGRQRGAWASNALIMPSIACRSHPSTSRLKTGRTWGRRRII